jgi:hypothetical protein
VAEWSKAAGCRADHPPKGFTETRLTAGSNPAPGSIPNPNRGELKIWSSKIDPICEMCKGLIELKENYLIIREFHKGTKSSTYFFLRNFNKYIHVSQYVESSRSIIGCKDGSPRYLIPFKNILHSSNSMIELACFSATNRNILLPHQIFIKIGSPTTNNRLECKTTSLEDLIDKISSGIIINQGNNFIDMDKIIDDILELQNEQLNYWNKILKFDNTMKFDKNKLLYNKIALLATYSCRYKKYGSLRSLWGKMAKEYQNWVLSLIDQALSQIFSRDRSSEDTIRRKHLQTFLHYKGFFSSSGEILRYKCKDLSFDCFITLELEHKFNNDIKADLAIKLPSGKYIVIECKQGFVESWFKKAIIQAKKYSKYADIVILVSHKGINAELKRELLKYYSYVYDSIRPNKKDNIREFIEDLKRIVKAQIA